MQIIKATGLDRKSGGAQWRDLRFGGPFLEMFFDKGIMGLGGRLDLFPIVLVTRAAEQPWDQHP